MSEAKAEKKKKPRGFAGVIYNQLMPLNDIEKFKGKYKETDLKILLNAKDGRHAALIIIDKGTLDVEGIPNKDKDALKKDVLGWEGKLETTTPIFLDLATGKLSTMGVLGKIITRKIKLKGMKKVMVLIDLFTILDEHAKNDA